VSQSDVGVFEQIVGFFLGSAWWSVVARVALFYAIAAVAYLLSRHVASRLVRLSGLAPQTHRPTPERRETLRNLYASAISVGAFAVATLASVAQFADTNTLIWAVGLFSAAFGLGAHPLIKDVLAGINLIFEDTYAVGEKVEILGAQGVIEALNLRTTWMRAPTGELFVVPNGDVRVVRNFSRGRFSLATITLKVATSDLGQALPLLEGLGEEAVVLLPNLLEPWQVISESAAVGQHTELTIMARARFGQAADMRPRAQALVQERLSLAGMALPS
jgi:small conductance mechanosensitive channel